ncbi:MAG TPA: hypothetical protein VIV40_14410, partial [Kofleriaceae bacterium]
MIATTRGLIVLAALAAVLLVVVLVGGPRRSGPVDHSIAPGFDEKQVTAIDFGRGQPAADHVRRVGNDWRIDDHTLADPAVIDAVFTALRGGRWHRRTNRSAIDKLRVEHGRPSITVGRLTLEIGPHLAGTDQTWIFRGDDALLVDNWVANALVPDPLALRLRHPIDCASAKVITATTIDGAIRIEGTRLVEPRALWIDDRWMRWLTEACANLEIVSLDGHADGRKGLHIVGSGEVTEVGGCANGGVFVETSAGAGCMKVDALRNLYDALHEIVHTAHGPIDLRPLPIEPAKLTLQDGSVVELSGRPRIGDSDADPDRVRELIGALSARGETAIER